MLPAIEASPGIPIPNRHVTEPPPGRRDHGAQPVAGRPHRASGELALHVLEVMVAVETSLGGTAFQPVDSGFVVPPPLPGEWDPYARTV